MAASDDANSDNLTSAIRNPMGAANSLFRVAEPTGLWPDRITVGGPFAMMVDLAGQFMKEAVEKIRLENKGEMVV